MLTGSLKSFQRYRRVLIGAALLAPLLLMGAAYLWIDKVLLVPRVPDQTSTALDCVAFICHDKGLPRLDISDSEAFLLQQTQRILSDASFARQFAAALRTSTPAEQQDFHKHIFGAFKPLLMRDVDKWLGLSGSEQADFLDDRIVEYNRMSRMAAGAPVAGVDLGPGVAIDKIEMLSMMQRKTTEAERAAVQKYGLALAARIQQILADPVLTAEFEKRIGN